MKRNKIICLVLFLAGLGLYANARQATADFGAAMKDTYAGLSASCCSSGAPDRLAVSKKISSGSGMSSMVTTPSEYAGRVWMEGGSFAYKINDGLAGLSDTASIDNAYVRVYQNKAVCADAFKDNFGSRVIVALNKLKIKSGRGVIRLKRGNIAVFRENEWYHAPRGEYFEVAFRKNHPPLKKPEKWIEPVKNTIIYEDEQFRVFEERLAPGDDRELHSHAQRVVVRLNEVQLTDPRYYPDGQPGTGIQVPNTVRYAEPVVHVVRNLSKIPLFNIVIEFKIHQ